MKLEALPPTEVAVPRIAASASSYPVAPPSEIYPTPGLVSDSQPTLGVPRAHEGVGTRVITLHWSDGDHHGMVRMFRPPPALLDEQGKLQFHVEKILA